MTRDSAAATSPTLQPTPARTCASPAFPLADAENRLAAASRALWAATLSLMAAFMQTPAPAHRYLLAGRIARNFEILSGQECFDGGCRDSFSRLARRWKGRAEQFSPRPRRRGLLESLF
jgi:hypothetical protein